MQLRLSLLFVALITLVPIAASAQSVDIIQETSLPRVDRSGAPVPKRSLASMPEAISRADCVDQLSIAFPLQLAGFQAQAHLEAWASLAGVDCGMQTNRNGAAAACWRVSGSIPLQPTPRVVVPVKKLLAGASFAGPDAPEDPHLCDTVDRTNIDVQFLYFQPGQLATPAVKRSVNVLADTIGPPPPGDVTILPGDRRVALGWRQLGQHLSVVTGVNVYCSPNLATPGVCASKDLTPGAAPHGDAARFLCGSVTGNSGTKAVADTTLGLPLTNDIPYAFALASVDELGNVGPLSPVLCEVPYAGATGADEPDAGDSSSCAAAPGASARGGAGSAIALCGVAVAAAMVRRRRPAA